MTKTTIDIDGQTYKVSGYADDGLPIIKAHAESFQDGFDEEGNPKISVKITVPPVLIGATPGKVQ
jgi:hypothetical protein